MKLALLILPSVLGDVLPMCLPMSVPATADGIDVSASSLEADNLLYDAAAFTFSDPAMVVSYDCMCGTKNTEFTTPCKAGETCNQLTGYCIPNCKTGSLNDEFCSCGTTKVFTDATTVTSTVPTNCLAGQFCVAYDELVNHDTPSYTEQASNQSGDFVPVNALNITEWNGEPQCVDRCVPEIKMTSMMSVCACGSGFCTAANTVCFKDRCMAICTDHFQNPDTAAVEQNVCKCGTEICVGDQVCSHGTCVNRCSNEVEIFEDQCWCETAESLCNKGQLCDGYSTLLEDRCVDECTVTGATRTVHQCRCANIICSDVATSVLNYCLNGSCVEGCTQDFYNGSVGDIWCACGSTSCERDVEWCEDGKCIPQCTSATIANQGNQGVAMVGTKRCWCGSDMGTGFTGMQVCSHTQPLCESNTKCSRFLDQR